MTKICHITSAHKRYDVRIFTKELKTLSKNFDAYLIVNDILQNEVVDNINIFSTNYSPKNRYQRMVVSIKKIKKIVKSVNADLYHIHDPELLRLVPYIKKKLKKYVIFDSHEDYLSTIGVKNWIPKILRKLVSRLYKLYESKVIRMLDGAVVCYHWTKDRYLKYINNVDLVFNYPIYDDEIDISKRMASNSIAYAGGISGQWLHHNIIDAINSIDNIKYNLAGNIKSKYGDYLLTLTGWKNVNYLGVLPYGDVNSEVYMKSSIGIALLDYIPQCKGKIGNLSNTKIFEYMHLGLPVICTDFDLWKEVIEKNNCGICINPHDISSIKSAIEFLITNPEKSIEFGINGRKMIETKYNWENEKVKLLQIYKNILEVKIND